MANCYNSSERGLMTTPSSGEFTQLLIAWSNGDQEETAEVLKVSPETATRDWRMAKAWLLHELQQDKAG